MPAKLDRCVEDVQADGKSESSAFAICNDAIKDAKTKIANILNPEEYDEKRKPKKKNNLHSMLTTPLEGKTKILKLKANAYRLKLGVLSQQDEVLLTRLLKTLENDDIADKRNQLTEKLILRQDVALRQLENPESDILKQELDSKDMDVTFMVEDILNTDKKQRGGIPISSTVLAKLSAKMFSAFEESEHPRAEGGEFTKGSGGKKGDKARAKSTPLARVDDKITELQESGFEAFKIKDQVMKEFKDELTPNEIEAEINRFSNAQRGEPKPEPLSQEDMDSIVKQIESKE